MHKQPLIYGNGVITNDPWLGHYLTSPPEWELREWEPPPHARRLVADAEAGMSSRELARKYGYAHGESAKKAFREWRVRLAKLHSL